MEPIELYPNVCAACKQPVIRVVLYRDRRLCAGCIQVREAKRAIAKGALILPKH
jgi:hypothetical protein